MHYVGGALPGQHQGPPGWTGDSEEGEEGRGTRRGRGGPGKGRGTPGPATFRAGRGRTSPPRVCGRLVGGRGRGWPQSPQRVWAAWKTGGTLRVRPLAGVGTRHVVWGGGGGGVSLHRWSLCLPHPPTKPHAPMTASPPGAGPRRFGRSRPDPPGAPGSPRAVETGKRGTARARGKPESPASGRRTEESAVPGPGPGTGAEVCGCRVPALSADLSSPEPWDERLDLAPQKATTPGTAWTKRTKLEDTRLDFCACAKAARGQDGGDARVRVAERRGPKRTHANTAGDWSSAKA